MFMLKANLFCYFCICVSVFVWAQVLRCLWIPEVFEPLGLKFQEYMKQWMWVLALKLCSSGRPVHAFSLCGIFPGPNLCLFCCSMSLFSNNTEVKNMTWDIVSWMLIFFLVCSCFYKSEKSVSESETYSLEVQIIKANDLKKRFLQLLPLPIKLWNIFLPVCTKFSSVLLYCKG